MKIKLVHFLEIILLATACSEKKPANTDDSIVQNPEYGIYQNYENPPISFELLDSIIVKLPDNELVADISFLETDENSNLYFYDSQQSKLISFSASGEFRWETGQEGKGPGDFENAYSMTSNGEHIFIGNLYGTRIDLFSYAGDFIKSYNAGNGINFGRIRGFNNKNELVIVSTIWGAMGSNVHFLTLNADSANVINQFEIIETGQEIDNDISVSPYFSVYKNQVISAAVMDYSIKFHNDSAEVTKEITRDFNKILGPGSHRNGNNISLRRFGGLENPVFLPDGHLISVVSWPTNVFDPDDYVRKSMEGEVPEVEFQHSIDIFNKDGNLLYSYEGDGRIPSIGEIAHVDHQGIIYTTSVGEEAVIYRYRLNLPEGL